MNTTGPINHERLLDRFLRYVRVDTTANDAVDRYPSSEGQLVLGALLAKELQAMGVAAVEQDSHGLVWGTIPSNLAHATPVIAFNAHLDTSTETSGANIQPQVIRNYTGGDITLPGDATKVIRIAENPELKRLHGKTLVTTDGHTLLGADDKAGVAVIMEFAHFLSERPDVTHGEIRILFTCDEEIGRGAMHVDLAKVGAQAAYTLDGAGTGEIDTETFSADLANITIRGVNIHPAIAKDRMVNSLRAAARFVERLPGSGHSPETTANRDGFFHPYAIEGGVAATTIKILLRDFETSQLDQKATVLRNVALQVAEEISGAHIEVAIKKQYRNMAEGLSKEPRAVALAQAAYATLSRPYKLTCVRGGTDGSQFTERGLPTPNLSTGEHNPHSPLEWTCLEEMVEAVQLIVEIAQQWGHETVVAN